MANQYRLKSDKPRAVEDRLHPLQAKDKQFEEQIHKRIEVQRQLDEIKLERTWEVWLPKKKIQTLEEKNKS
jgi:hypothetical protein